MKRFISILLAIMLVTALVPTSFAAEKNAEVHTNAYNYILKSGALGKPEGTSSPLELTGKKVSEGDQWNPYIKGTINSLRLRPDDFYWNTFTSNCKGTTVFAISVDIPVAGTYVPRLSHLKQPSGYIHDFYLVKNTLTDAQKALDGAGNSKRNAVKALCNKDNYIGTVNMYAAESTSVVTSFDAVTVSEADVGEWLLVAIAVGLDEDHKPLESESANKMRLFAEATFTAFELYRDTNAEAVANGELTYNTTLGAMNTDKMYVNASTAYNVEGLRTTSSLRYFPYLDWKYTTTLIGTGSDRTTKGQAEEPYHTMNIQTGTDPWKLDNTLNAETGNPINAVSTQIYKDLSNGFLTTFRYAHYYDKATGEPKDTRPYVGIRVNIPYGGRYTMTLAGAKSYYGVVADVRFAKATTEERIDQTIAVTLPIVGQYDGTVGTSEEKKSNEDLTYGNPITVDAPVAGEYWIVFDTSKRAYEANTNYVEHNTDYQNFKLIGIKLTPVSYDPIISFDLETARSSITVGEEVSVISPKVTYKTAGETAYAGNITYESSAESIATVSESGIVTPVSAGTALITATSAEGFVDSLWITVEDAPEDKNVLYCVTNNVEEAQDIKSADRGTPITVTAKDITGYTFRHWVRGTEDKGTWLSSDKSYTFTLMTKTYLTAVYSEDATGKVVEFFNENGEFLSDAVVAEDGTVELPAENPKRTGFKFLKWLISETEELTAETVLESLVTRAVARYESTGDTFAVTAPNGDKLNGASSANYEYDAPITVSSSYKYTSKGTEYTVNPYNVYWYRNGKQVDYGTEYTYHIWDKATITKSHTGEAGPLVVLDDVVKADNAYMIEYDAAGKQIIEVGILFGREGTTPTIEACDGKATSQRTAEHGQFTAKVDDATAVARGYLIYNDGGTYRVIYSD